MLRVEVGRSHGRAVASCSSTSGSDDVVRRRTSKCACLLVGSWRRIRQRPGATTLSAAVLARAFCRFPPSGVKWRDGGHAVPAAVTFDKFTDMDSALDVCADLTDEEIGRQVLEPDSGSDSEDDAPAIVRPSNAELTQALNDSR